MLLDKTKTTDDSTPREVLRLFGPPRVVAQSAGPPRKAYLIAAMLDLSPSGRMTREEIAARLWEDTSSDAAGGLRQLLLRTRRWERASGLALLETGRTMLGRGEGTIGSDLGGFLRMSTVETVSDLDRLTALYAGDFLAGIDDAGGDLGQWIAEKRTWLRERFIRLGLQGTGYRPQAILGTSGRQRVKLAIAVECHQRIDRPLPTLARTPKCLPSSRVPGPGHDS